MGLESGTYIDSLNESWPIGSEDTVSQSDDHLRLLKTTIKNTFPNIDGEVTPTPAQLNMLAELTATVEELDLLAGTSATAAQLNELHTFQRLFSNQVITYSNELTSVTELEVPVLANTNYKFTFFVSYWTSEAADVGGVEYSINYPSSEASWIIVEPQAADDGNVYTSTSTSANTGIPATISIYESGVLKVDLFLEVGGTGGDVSIQFRIGTAGATEGEMRISQRSWVEYRVVDQGS